jgi:TrmH family RNA methyltransferase
LVVEGAELLAVALEAGAAVEAVYVAPGGRDGLPVARAVSAAYEAGARVFDLAPGVLERVADTVSPQPVLAVVGFVPATLEDLSDASLVLVCADVRDPGNAGTIIRTADASGADAVVCCEGTVDPTNPKTVRASAGSVFHTPIVMGGTAVDVMTALADRGLVSVGTVVRDGVDYTAFDWSRRVALVLGNEASGLDGGLLDALDQRISIPMAGRAESLNVGVSAAVLCFEARRQRQAHGGTSAGSTMQGMDASETGSEAGTETGGRSQR